ncbi:MAG TPA: hypothetical protein PKV48_00865 [Thermodesulfobacteriota bacterium]|nr:hypothetical protein [Thermodesulfobacteriota bacterium]
MMTWNIIEQELKSSIIPKRTRILKCDGTGRRLVVSNDGVKIGMETGVQTAQTKAITYDMIKNAYETLIGKGRFDSRDFRKKYQSEYEAGPCRYSMVGGVLVELGVARLMSAGSSRSCYYLKI